ncbi:hypothetical protein GCM10009864_18710 [Streptomyces lunalinharesii]|uniref:Uncharacterized protein n=1 Tax=Streptomyces lunalinharesii TaxID=333384 RepID=A0ABP6DVU6_9ACTN
MKSRAHLILKRSVRRLGVELADFRVLAPCVSCDNDWSVDLGKVSIPDLREIARAIVHRIDMLEVIQQQRIADNLRFAEVDDL